MCRLGGPIANFGPSWIGLSAADGASNTDVAHRTGFRAHHDQAAGMQFDSVVLPNLRSNPFTTPVDSQERDDRPAASSSGRRTAQVVPRCHRWRTRTPRRRRNDRPFGGATSGWLTAVCFPPCVSRRNTHGSLRLTLTSTLPSSS
jgi:hypothetical protein